MAVSQLPIPQQLALAQAELGALRAQRNQQSDQVASLSAALTLADQEIQRLNKRIQDLEAKDAKPVAAAPETFPTLVKEKSAG